MISKPAHSIFISYARKDGRPFARRLRAELESLGIPLWRDIEDMEPGEQWRRQLEEAIEQSSVMVLVLTEAVASSRVVLDEWTHARSVGTYVIPIVEVTQAISKAPEWARKVDIVNADSHNPDYDSIWKRFLGLLRNPPPRRPRPFAAPGLPPRFVQRPQEFARIVGHILDADRNIPIALTTALQGAGGFGKTTLAIALCHDSRVRAAFDGGILWVQFTPTTSQADALALLNDQIRLLDPDGPVFSEPTLASARFRELLRGRDVLVVLDDVWSEWYLPLFLHKGTTYVITTRRQPVVATAGADRVLVDQFEIGEAAELLSRWLRQSPHSNEMLLLRDLAARLGEWALLLELVGAELSALTAGGRALPEAIEYITQRLDRRGFSYLDRHQEGNRNAAIGDSLDASLTMLAQGQRERFHELGILLGDADLPFQTIGQLWAATAAYGELDTEDALEAMQRFALFTRYDARSKVVRLHNVIRQVLSGRLTDTAGLNEKLVGHWGDAKRLPDEYAWRNLLFHLRNAGRQSDVPSLLFDFGWIHAKLRAVGLVAVIADYQSEPADPDCRLLASTLTMAGASLADPEQLPAQLVGRLGRLDGTGTVVRDLLQEAGAYESTPALLPMRVLLPSIAQGVHRTIQIGALVLSGALSDDKVHLLIGLANGTVQIWNWRGQNLVATLECGVGPVFQLEIKDQRLAVGGYHDHWTNYSRPSAPAEVWNWTSRERLYSVGADVPDTQQGFAIAFGDGFAAMTTGQTNNLIHLFDWTADTLVQVIDPEAAKLTIGSENRPGGVAIAGKYVLYHEHGSNRIGVWAIPDYRYCGDISGQLNREAAPFVVDGRLYVHAGSTTRPSTARRFSYRLNDEGHAPGIDVRHYDENVSAAMASGQHFFICSDVVRIADSASERLVGVLEGHSDAIRSINALDDVVITTSVDGTIRIWDWPPAVETGSAIERDVGAGEKVKRFYQPSITAIATQGESAFVGTLGSLEEWSWASATRTTAMSNDEPTRALAVSDQWLIFSRFWRIKHGMLRARSRVEWTVERRKTKWRQVEGFNVSNGTFDFLDRGVVSAALLGDSCAVVVQDQYTPANALGSGVYTGNFIFVIDLRREECELVLGEWISAVALSPHIVAGGTVKGHIDIWDRATGTLRQRLSNHSGHITGLQIEGNQLLSCSSDGTVQVWDLTTFAGVRALRHNGAVHALRVRGGLLVTASEDHRLRLFDWRGGQELACFTDDAALVACEIAGDSATILGGGKSGQLHILRANRPLREAMSRLEG